MKVTLRRFLICAAHIAVLIVNGCRGTYFTPVGAIVIPKDKTTSFAVTFLIPEDALDCTLLLNTKTRSDGDLLNHAKVRVKVTWRNTGATTCEVAGGFMGRGMRDLASGQKLTVFDGKILDLWHACGESGILEVHGSALQAEILIELTPEAPLPGDLHLDLEAMHAAISP